MSQEYHLSLDVKQASGESAHFRISSELSDLFELIATGDSGEDLAHRACEFVSSCVRSDSVVLLEDHGEGTTPVPLGSWSSSKVPTDDPRLSRTLVSRVIDDRTSITFQRIDGDHGLPSESIVSLGIRSAMAVPLFDNERVRGILYVDSLGVGGSYTESDLQLVTAMANAVAVRLRNLSLEREQASAAEIQRSFLPATLPTIPGYDLLVHIDMCRAVGGDLYHTLPLPGGRTLIALGDVTGKGMPAALAMSACMVLIGALGEICDSVESMAEQIHRQLFKVFTPTQFVTLFLGELDHATGTLTYVNAGHEPPLLAGGSDPMVLLPPTMPPLAMFEECQVKSTEVTLKPEELLAIFSDGISEATLDGENFLGLQGVKEILTTRREEPLADIRNAIEISISTYLCGSRPSDDISLMLLRRDQEEDTQ